LTGESVLIDGREGRASHPGDVKRDIATKELARLRAAITRLIEAYQEQLISLDELRTRMPSLRHREMAVQNQLAALDAELVDAGTYITLAESLESFLAKLQDAAQSLDVADRQRVLRLVVKEVQVGPEAVVIKHSIPMPDHPPDPGYLLRTWHHDRRNTQLFSLVVSGQITLRKIDGHATMAAVISKGLGSAA
jgi:hypothetical protein